ncbi:MAG: hypothetical protein A4E49_02513 [Methanosaeta sp. PtaU1.Bin112]|nr:MAG: hypothetical protein A4E49_02513 [Methanosaeta sp. PtaU1.Bin112]
MPFLMRGALIEYGSDFLGPIPNAVLFQFNPETLRRDIEIPARQSGAASREADQAGDLPVERINLTAYFSAADRLNENNFLARAFGIGAQLAALEKMVQPPGMAGRALQEVVDAVSDAIARRRGGAVTQSIPRQHYPRVLFVWGLTRILPVTIDSLSITEQEYDYMLNPVRAEVSLGLSVLKVGPCSDDLVALGAMEYTNLATDLKASSNLAEVGTQVYELINF